MSKDSNYIMIKTNDSLETDPQKMANLMNKFYVNIASKIGGSINLEQNDMSYVDYVNKCFLHFSEHPSVKIF